ncbi:MAG: hypothetical protein D3923_02680 [Candidatus Electrothrix sp. AR3]|nr:hypothetical protein [Candidatus Electrothrix sp. AR3]
MNKKKLLQPYKILLYAGLVSLALIFGLIGHNVTAETTKAILLNLASGCFYALVIESIIDFLLKKNNVLQNERDIARKNEKISVVLKHEKIIEVPGKIRREDFSRQEVLGRIGMIPMKEKGQRFTIKYSDMESFFEEINQISESKGDKTLYVYCSKEDLEQFDLPEK